MERISVIWRCANQNCNTYHVRRIRENVWERGDVQSPCPVCKVRTRLNDGNTKRFDDHSDALMALDMVRGVFL